MDAWRHGSLEPVCDRVVLRLQPDHARLWYNDQHSNSSRLQQYNPATNTWTQHAVFDPDGDVTAAIDTKRNLLVAVGGGKVLVWRLDAPNNAPILCNHGGSVDRRRADISPASHMIP